MEPLLIVIAILLMAILYSTVGHGGGSGYLAVLAIASIAPETMRPTALLLNVAVSMIATWKFSTTSTFRKDLFVPLICVSVPAAYLGGLIEIPSAVYRPVVGVILMFAALRLCTPFRGAERFKTPSTLVLCLAGGCIGILSGVIGIGGGIFLSPLVLLLGWATAKQTAAMTAPFILVNSIAALGGIMTDHGTLPIDFTFVAPLALAVVFGGFIGASFGSRRLGYQGLRFVLGGVLLIASIKMFLLNTHTTQTTLPIEVKSTQ